MTRLIPGKLYSFDSENNMGYSRWTLYDIEDIGYTRKASPVMFLSFVESNTRNIYAYYFLLGKRKFYRKIPKMYGLTQFEDCFTEIS
jgi:hypothetical protein